MDPLAIEIISPDDRDRDVEEKVALYLPYGTLHVVVDPQTASITIQEPGDAPRTTSRSGSIDVTDDLRLENEPLFSPDF
jgi:Uma2 family endonuclease